MTEPPESLRTADPRAAEPETAEQIDEAAIAWVARLDRHGGAPHLEAELAAWLAGDQRRAGALLRARAIWRSLDSALAAEVPRERRRGMTRRFAAGGGAGLLAAGLAGAWVMLREEPMTTTVGEVRHVPLADGSAVILNTDTRMGVALRRDVRRVRISDGEAWFQVAKDAARPFVVEAGPVRVQAVGTAFSVRRLEGGADVLVTEGVVEAWLVGAEKDRTRISAGETAQVREGQAVVASTSEGGEMDRRLAWRAGKIELEGETLADAVAQFNRFNRRKLVLQDPRLGGRRLYGVFRANDPEGFSRSVAVILGAHVHIDAREITIGDHAQT